jgi:hypothetical protein
MGSHSRPNSAPLGGLLSIFFEKSVIEEQGPRIMHRKNNTKNKRRNATIRESERARERKHTQRNGQGEEEQPGGAETLSGATTLLGT